MIPGTYRTMDGFFLKFLNSCQISLHVVAEQTVKNMLRLLNSFAELELMHSSAPQDKYK